MALRREVKAHSKRLVREGQPHLPAGAPVGCWWHRQQLNLCATTLAPGLGASVFICYDEKLSTFRMWRKQAKGAPGVGRTPSVVTHQGGRRHPVWTPHTAKSVLELVSAHP